MTDEPSGGTPDEDARPSDRSAPLRTDGGEEDDGDRYDHAPAVEYDASEASSTTEDATTDRSPPEPPDAEPTPDRSGTPGATEGPGVSLEDLDSVSGIDEGDDLTTREVATGIAAVYGAVTVGLALAALGLSGFERELPALTSFGFGYAFVSAEVAMQAVAPLALVLAVLSGGYAARELDPRDATSAVGVGVFAGSVALSVTVTLAVWLPKQALGIGLAGLVIGAIGLGVGAVITAALVVRVADRFLDLSPSVHVVAVENDEDDEDEERVWTGT